MKAINKEKVKDWFIINRIRITNFIGEHKYISSAIGLFVFSIIIATVVFAGDDRLTSVDSIQILEENGLVLSTEHDENSSAQTALTFSNAIYSLKYKLSSSGENEMVDEVEIRAELEVCDSNNNCSSDNGLANSVKWAGATDDEQVSFEATTENEKFENVMVIKSENVVTNSDITQNFSLRILNAPEGTKVKIKNLTIKAGSDATAMPVAVNEDAVSITTHYTKTKDLSVLVKGGAAIKSASQADITREAKFGLSLGFFEDSGTLDLKGLYITNDATIDIEASELVNGASNILTDLSVGEDASNNPIYDAGIFTDEIASRKYFSDLQVISTSGKANLVRENNPVEGTEKEVVFHNATDLYFEYSDDFASYFVDPEVTEVISDYITSRDSYAKLTLNGSDLTATPENGVNIKIDDELTTNTLEEGKVYNIIYDVQTEYGIVSFKQNIHLDTPQNKDYILLGPKVVYLSQDEEYEDYGILAGDSDAEDLIPEYYAGAITSVSDIPEEEEKKYESFEDAKAANSNAKIFSEVYEIGDDLVIRIINLEEQSSSQKIFPTNYSYKFKISNIGMLDEITPTVIDGKYFYQLGTYYLSVPSKQEESVITLKATNGSSSNSDSVNIKKISNGTNSLVSEVYVTEEEGLVKVDNSNRTEDLEGDYYTAAIGERIQLYNKFSYGVDADYDMEKLEFNIKVDENLIPTTFSGSTNNFARYYFSINGQESDENMIPDIDIKYCTSEDECEIEPEAYDPNTDGVITNIKVIISSTEETKLTGGSEYVLKTEYEVKPLDNYTVISDESFIFDTEVAVINEATTDGSDDNIVSASTQKVYLTPYKLRANSFIGKRNSDNEVENYSKNNITLDVSRNNTYTMQIMPYVTAPIMELYSNAFGYSELTNVEVKVVLPEGINYMYNDSYYIQPTNNTNDGNNRVLTYKYGKVEPNKPLEEIYFDFNADIALKSGVTLNIITTIGENMWNNTSVENDLSSSSKYKTNNNKINIQNTENISYGQYTYNMEEDYSNSIDKDDQFIFKTRLYNNSSETKENVTVYTVLPFIDENESNYNGTYWISQMPEGALCTTSPVTRETVDSIDWVSCEDFKDEDTYYGFTAYKVDYKEFPATTLEEAAITVQTSGNYPDDKYKFNSYLSDGDKLITFKPIELKVISKKISGTVWEDFNYDGKLDEDELLLENVVLNLYSDSDELIDTTTPDENGYYSFSGLEEGDYYITADFNNDKYTYTTPYAQSTDLSKISVFYSDSSEIVNPDSNNSNVSDNEGISAYSDDNDGLDGDNNSDGNDGLDGDNASDGNDDLDGDNASDGNDDLDGDNSSDGNDDSESSSPVDLSNVVKTDLISITIDTKEVKNINLGLVLRKNIEIKMNKYITKAEVTNALGITNVTEFGNTKLAKLNVKTMTDVKIKVVYQIEIQNVKYYPGYVTLITEHVPDGMEFNANYAENIGWTLNPDGTLSNTSLQDEIISENEKKYLTVAFDIVSGEAGSFVNFASIDDIQLFGGDR